ncbi:unnamed protein product [marine sediment metagenome]|uniref:FAD-dependent oxidoreductase 2 FAD-binding domain-containing protein n=1 Tax=marine sediment metagenome TaxID=412755 RepID=X0ZVU2_9ZZZZ
MKNNNILIIGAGISGIEAALTLGEQGYRVILVEKTVKKIVNTDFFVEYPHYLNNLKI